MTVNYLYTSLLTGISLLFFTGCKKDVLLPNQAPDTHLSVESINLSGNNRLNSSVRLSWYGTDIDGYITAYEYSVNGSDWTTTQSQDITFKFSIEPGKDTTDIGFRVRAIDNNGLKDETPAFVSIPLKNAPPSVTIEQATFPADTALIALTFRWKYEDPDGNQTVTKAFLKVNNGNWTEIDRSKSLITLIAENTKQTGVSDARLYYNTESNPSTVKINNFNNQGANTVYLKVLDIAGSESKIDTSNTVFIKAQKEDLLFINGQSSQIAEAYANLISNAGKQYDLIDLAAESGKYLPKFWNPTFTLIVNQYSSLFINSDQSLITNPSSGSSGLLLEFLSPVLQSFTDNGGKSFITTSFPSGYDISLLRGALPIDSISGTSGQATISKDSSIYDPQGKLPSLSPKNLLLGMDPMVPSVDATVLYKGKFTPFGAWKGPNVVGVKRNVAGKVSQVFFSVELYLFNQDNNALKALFDHIFNVELNG